MQEIPEGGMPNHNLDQPATGLPPKPAKLEELEIKSLEIHFLKMQNLKMQGDRLQEDLKKCHQLILDEQQKLREYRESLSTKYGLDLSKCHIEADGTIKPGVRPIQGIPGM